MKNNRKRPSLADAKHQNNLKDMLRYYNDKSQLKNPSSPFQPIYEYEEILTQEVILPKAAKENIIISFMRNESLTSKGHRNKAEHIQGDLELQNRRNRPSYSRENLAEMNSRLRKIRTSHMRRVSEKVQEPKENREEYVFDAGDLLTTREALSKSSELLSRKLLLTPYGQRAINNIIEETPQDGIESPSQKLRPISESVGKEGSFRLRNPGQAPRNPHVIYQFQSHLKAKRVDDNPKVLGSIIRKKSGQMGKQQLYGYINCLIKRREK